MAKAYHLRKCEFGQMLSNIQPTVWTLPLGATQTFKAGDWVYRVGGYVIIYDDDAGNAHKILGMAKEDATSGDAGAVDIEVLVFTELTGLRMCIDGATDELEATDMGKLYGVGVSSNMWYVDKDDTSHTRVRIQKFIHEIGDEHAFVLATVLPAYREVV